jgi:hypothetical protein
MSDDEKGLKQGDLNTSAKKNHDSSIKQNYQTNKSLHDEQPQSLSHSARKSKD